MGDLSTLEVIIIAIVEGLTEFLPVSSTGHMIITQNLLGIESTEFVKAFTVIIQFGAILSVVWLYWKRFFRLNHTPVPADTSALKRFLHKFDFYWKLLVAFVPAAVLGFLFSDKVDEMLESVTVVAVMLVIGGVFMLFCDKIFSYGLDFTVGSVPKALNAIIDIFLLVSEVGTKSNISGVPSTCDFYCNCIQWKSDRCPWLFNTQSNCIHQWKFMQKQLTEVFSKSFQKLVGMLFGELCDHLADFSIVNRSSQLICQTGFTCTGIKFG